MTAQFLYQKDFQSLTNDQKIFVYKYLTPGQTDANSRPAVPSKGMSQDIIDEIYGKGNDVKKSLGAKLDQRDNSPEFKKLSCLHPQARAASYLPQENKIDFRSQPKYSYSNKINLKLKRDKLSSSPATKSPRADSKSPRSRNNGVDGYFLKLRKQSNNTELQPAETRANASGKYSPA